MAARWAAIEQFIEEQNEYAANSTPEPSVGDVCGAKRDLEAAWRNYVSAARSEVVGSSPGARR
jgi:hypothetical protein